MKNFKIGDEVKILNEPDPEAKNEIWIIAFPDCFNEGVIGLTLKRNREIHCDVEIGNIKKV